jgi:Toprim-like
MTIEPDKKSRFNCFSCKSGSAVELLQMLQFHELDKYADMALAYQILQSEQLEVVPLPEYGEFAKSEETWEYHPWPEWVLEYYPDVKLNNAAWQYLLGRGVTIEQVEYYDLRFDASKQMIVFPIRDAYGSLAGLRGRSIVEGVKGWEKHYDYSHEGVNNVKGVWYNEQSLQLPGPVVVVEGQFDALKVAHRHKKVIANLTAKPSKEKIFKLALTGFVIYIPDTDAPGQATIAIYQSELEKFKVPFKVLQLPQYVKDPGDCSPDYLGDAIEKIIAEN